MAYTVKDKIDNEHLGAEIKKLAEGRVSAAQADNATTAAATQGGTYVQADVQTIAALANALKTDLNALLAKLRTAGLMAS